MPRVSRVALTNLTLWISRGNPPAGDSDEVLAMEGALAERDGFGRVLLHCVAGHDLNPLPKSSGILDEDRAQEHSFPV